jgi:hypothetical protein
MKIEQYGMLSGPTSKGGRNSRKWPQPFKNKRPERYPGQFEKRNLAGFLLVQGTRGIVFGDDLFGVIFESASLR